MSDKKNSLKDKYTAVIIGGGRIAAGFDEPDDTEILTHAHAYNLCQSTYLAGIFDIKHKTAHAAALKWGAASFTDFHHLMKETAPDIVSICTPTDDHYETLRKLVPYKPKLVICEKPVAKNVSEVRSIFELYKKENIPVLVNYSRRFDESVIGLRKKIKNGDYGRVLSASGIYTKGTMHNGSHIIDLARYFFGEVKKIAPFTKVYDYTDSDPSVSGVLSFDDCDTFHLIAGDNSFYSILEVDILLQKGRARLIDSGTHLELFDVEEDPIYKGFYGLKRVRTKETLYTRACLRMVQNAVNYLDGKEGLLCNLDDAIKAQVICEKLLEK